MANSSPRWRRRHWSPSPCRPDGSSTATIWYSAEAGHFAKWELWTRCPPLSSRALQELHKSALRWRCPHPRLPLMNRVGRVRRQRGGAEAHHRTPPSRLRHPGRAMSRPQHTAIVTMARAAPRPLNRRDLLQEQQLASGGVAEHLTGPGRGGMGCVTTRMLRHTLSTSEALLAWHVRGEGQPGTLIRRPLEPAGTVQRRSVGDIDRDMYLG